MNRYVQYCKVKSLWTPVQKCIWILYAALLAAVLLFQDVLSLPFAAAMQSPSVPLVKSLFFVILLTGSVFAIQRYVGSLEYRYFRSLPLTNALRNFALLAQGFPCYALYGLLSCVFRGSRGTLALAQLPYSLVLIGACSSLAAHGILWVQTWIRRGPGSRRLLLGALGLAALGVLLVPGWLPPKSSASRMLLAVEGHFLSPNGYVLLPCLLWLGYYTAHAAFYESGYQRKSAARKRKNTRLYKGLYRNLVYKDLLLCAGNPLVALFYVIAAALGILSATYRFDASINGVILCIFVFVLSTLSEELMKNDMASLPFLRTLPFAQGDFFRAKIGSVSTALALPGLLFLGLSALGGTYSLGAFALLGAAALLMNALLCAMQCAVIMGHAAHPEKVQLSLTVSVFCTLFCPVWPLLYLLVAARRAEREFCGGRR